MKTIGKLLVVVLFISCVFYYLGIDPLSYLGIQNSVENKKDPVRSTEIEDKKPAADNVRISNIAPEYLSAYDQMIKFLLEQKKDRKLFESYSIKDNSAYMELKGRSYIADNALAVVALLNDNNEDTKREALDTLKNLASIQNTDGSWYDFYDILGQTAKVSGKDYMVSGAGSNSLVLYAYSYYTNKTNDRSFMDTMKKSSDFIISKDGGKNEGLYEADISANGVRSVKNNILAYFGLREYAMSNITSNYYEYKAKMSSTDRIAAWVRDNCLDKGAFIKGYTGTIKNMTLDLDTQVLGAVFAKSTKLSDNSGYDLQDLNVSLTKLYKETDGIQGYKIDNDSKNSGYIYVEGTCKVPVALFKFDDNEKSEEVANYIVKMLDSGSSGAAVRGTPYSTNKDSKINMPDCESLSSTAWSSIAFQYLSDSGVSKSFFGNEDDIFNNVK